METAESRHGKLLEVLKTGGLAELQGACERLVLSWRDAPVEPLLALKAQFQKMGLEHREAHLEEALASVAEKRPAPFAAAASDPEHPLWRQAVEVLAVAGGPAFLDVLLGLLKGCPRRCLPDVLRALAAFDDPRAGEAAAGFLSDEDENVFFEAVMAVKRRGAAGLRALEDALAREQKSGSERAAFLREVIEEAGQPG